MSSNSSNYPESSTAEEPGRQEPDSAADAAGKSATGRKFPCPGCGAKLDFDPSQRALKCPYCGYAEEVAPTSDAVRERDWEEYWQHANEQGDTIAGRSSEVQCKACAAVVLLEDKVAEDRCPYCGNDLENKPVSAKSMILPEGILPFRVDQKTAVNGFKRWIEGRWFAPGDLKQLANLGRWSGIYVPFWTYDSMTYTHYTGQRGDNYQEVETYTEPETYFTTDSNGNQVSQTRMVTKQRIITKIRWWPVAGDVENFFDDVLVCASHSIPADLMNELAPWDIHNVEAFRPEFLAGFQTERYTVDLNEGFEHARGIMDGQIRTLCCRNIGGDHQQLYTVNTQHTAITFKHILQPVWLAPYKYRDKTYRIAVNARTGEVVGTRPYSYWKPVLWVLAILAIAAIVAGVAALFGAFDKGGHGNRGQQGVRQLAGIAESHESLQFAGQSRLTGVPSVDRVARPSRQGGRVAKRQDSTPFAWYDDPTDHSQISERRAFVASESERYRILSLRDPTGAEHAVGPPQRCERMSIGSTLC